MFVGNAELVENNDETSNDALTALNDEMSCMSMRMEPYTVKSGCCSCQVVAMIIEEMRKPKKTSFKDKKQMKCDGMICALFGIFDSIYIPPRLNVAIPANMIHGLVLG